MATRKQYVCELCKKIFNQKIEFTRHQNKKTACINIIQIEEINKEKEIKSDNKSILINVFKTCLNILRDSEGLTGEKALRNLSYLLILKLIEPRIGNEIDFDSYEFRYDDHFEDNVLEQNKNKLLLISRFSNLAKEPTENIPNLFRYLWDIILSVHPSTKNIFLSNKYFDIQHQNTYRKLIDKLVLVDLSKTEYDVLGNAYEEVIQDIMTGKVLGQFFTQPLIKKMMVKLINPKVFDDGTIESCGDPTMGTGGFLITYLQDIIKQAKIRDIKLNWDFIKNEGLYGKELEPDTFQLAVSNMLISSGYMFDKLERGDSIREPIIRKFDCILANPPFGIKGMNYDTIHNDLKDKYIPIKSDNAVSLFIQAIIYMLKINGRCAVVLPDGQDLFSKSNNTLVAVREYLMKTCDLKEIIYLPSGIFTYTTIKTCVFYFIKKKEGKDVFEITKNKNVKKETTIKDFKFSKIHQTVKVSFYDYNPYEDIKNLLVEVPIEKIANNNYSLNYTEYISDIVEDNKYSEGTIIKTLGEMFECKMGKFNSNDMDNQGNIPFYSCKSNNPVGFHSNHSFDYLEYLLLVTAGGSKNNMIGEDVGLGKCYYVSGKSACRANVCALKYKLSEIINIKYIYYYLNINRLNTNKKAHFTTSLGTISLNDIKSIKIPISSLEKQNIVVEYLDFIYEQSNKTSTEKINELKKLNAYSLSMQKIFGENEIKTLGEICEIEKNLIKYDTSYGKSKGNYKFHTGGERTDLYVDKCDIKDLYIIQNRTNGSGKCNLYLDKNFSLAKQTIVYRALNKEEFCTKYIYYYLNYNKQLLENGFIGANHKNISKDYIKSIKIHIPSLEVQQKIVDYCDYNCNLINQLENVIEINKNKAKEFIDNVVKSNVYNIINDEDNYIINDEDNYIINDEDKDNYINSDSDIDKDNYIDSDLD